MLDIPFGAHNIWGATAGMIFTLYRLCIEDMARVSDKSASSTCCR